MLGYPHYTLVLNLCDIVDHKRWVSPQYLRGSEVSLALTIKLAGSTPASLLSYLIVRYTLPYNGKLSYHFGMNEYIHSNDY